MTQKQKWTMNYKLDVPNIATWVYDVNYDMDISDSIETTFTTLENVISEQEANKVFEKNAKAAEKEKQKILQRKVKDLEKWNNTFSKSEMNMYNMKTISDLRSMASAIEAKRARDSKNNMLKVLKDAKRVHYKWRQFLYVWKLNYDYLHQDKNDFISPYTGEGYEVRVLTTIWTRDSQYQVWGREIEDDTFIWSKVWNYVPKDDSMPDSLFDIDLEKKTSNWIASKNTSD